MLGVWDGGFGISAMAEPNWAANGTARRDAPWLGARRGRGMHAYGVVLAEQL